ncbi:hypothetical protein IOD16_24725 [Saccharothrix sp. 6-C]|uniref:hypothetical protein n=1 Tax=Saccharothrix sp. 6-C TaxID=2781735 RepID=UPI0019172183|nr:hypothetical protein [Saccharothrix sp. 6-C]QQQ74376.1 hypothetical protein IOD16_24725 [Saccharothrix sp. 6-C]
MAERIMRPTATAPTTNGPDPPVRPPIADRARVGSKAGPGGIGLPVDRPVLVLVGGGGMAGTGWRRRVAVLLEVAPLLDACDDGWVVPDDRGGGGGLGAPGRVPVLMTSEGGSQAHPR